MNNPALLTTREVLDRLGYADPSTIARLVARGDLTPAFKAPGKRGAYAFHADEIDRFLAARNERGAA